ncbi:hypothetical protein PoB_006417900 [Plakobranchus ocellatus]|uniref:Uncharacterized protein n=1 Tax=Plakobranchus ocellatus TaxID=259542 RepID=A0AAV4D0E6_9GAST|nr:hypothetical protein PoB_006417900 [Plakobranchus ocellatus]
MFILLLVVVSLGLTSADKCDDTIAKCESSHWTRFKDVALPDLQCEAARSWLDCLMAISDCGIVDFTEALNIIARNCFDTDDSPCRKAVEECQNKYESVIHEDPKLSCPRAMAWKSCLTDPAVVRLCGSKIPKSVQKIVDDLCYT